MKKFAMITVILLVAVMAFSYTSKLSEGHEGFKGEPLSWYRYYTTETKEEITIAKYFVYAPNQITGIDMPEETLAIVYFEITDHTYMEIYGKEYIYSSMGMFKIKGTLKEEYEKYARKDDTYDAYFVDKNDKDRSTIAARRDRQLYYICSPLIDKTKEYTVHLKFGSATGEVTINEGK